MTTHEEWVIKCPNCERAYDLFWISSGNNFGGKFWSDGCSVSNCSYPLTGLYACPRCRWVFTIRDCEKIDPEDPSVEDLFSLPRYSWLPKREPSEAGRRKRYVDDVRLEKCEALLHYHRWLPQNDFEPILRLGWWWHGEREDRMDALHIDDALEATERNLARRSEPIVANMQRLIETLPSGQKNALIVGDLQRRLGNFPEAINAYGQMASYHTDLSGKLIALSRRGYRSVVQVK